MTAHEQASEIRVYRRRRRSLGRLWRIGDLMLVRALSRALACGFLFAVIGYGLVRGEHLDSIDSPDHSLLGRIAPVFGYSAQTIRISGLERRAPEAVVAAIGIQPGSPLFGFDADEARNLLQNIDWVEKAGVRLVFPNTLEIDVTEREPFAIWQREGRYYVVDRTGVAMSADVKNYSGILPLVSGDGAQLAAYDLFNQLASHRELAAKVKAAARVGGRRWNLYFANNVAVALPAEGVEAAMEWIERADREHGLLSKGIVRVDLRLPDRAVITPQGPVTADPSGSGLKVNER
jgi:cell division protein FtsQ